MDFASVYRELNTAQKTAVDTIDGPLLVVAGPGTGKTQLLSARVARILEVTDTLPQNILCLTFTENGALNMRDRLTRFIGQAAYDVQISTYHAFGGDIISRFPQFFTETRLQSPVDELGKHQLVQGIIEELAYANPLKQTQYHLGDLTSTISEVKRALLDSDDLRAISRENLRSIRAVNQALATIMPDFVRMPTQLDKAHVYFDPLLAALRATAPAKPVSTTYGSVAAIAARDLETALAEAESLGKTTPLTAWKNQWLTKDADNTFIMQGGLETERMQALADVLDRYQAALESRGWYDFDDMIIRVIHAFEQYPELKYALQEQYLYILLDEFQDTNAAQLRIVELLTDNPLQEGRPNVMAVGDDDQAIYAFQGAQYSNMVDFYRLYRDVVVVHLSENYRSHPAILESAEHVAEQIDARLTSAFPDMQKHLVAANPARQPATIIRQALTSPVAEDDWVAERIAELVKSGTPAAAIAVLSPRHKQLEPLVAHLNARNIAVRYEKRENILHEPVVRQLIMMSRLVVAIHDHDDDLADALWPEVLSYDFWELPISGIWQLSWSIADMKRDTPTSWTRQLIESTDILHDIGVFFLGLAHLLDQENLEVMLDYLIGTTTLSLHDSDTPVFTSPLRRFMSHTDKLEQSSEQFYETLSHLAVLRARVRDYARSQDEALTLRDFLRLVSMYEEAGVPMINTSPYAQSADAVQLMTVFKAKGLEFEHVFLLSCQDDVWGGSSRGSGNKISLPANLQPIRHAGANDDERLRILYVAMTRAKVGLYLTSFSESYTGKQTRRLKYFNEQQQADGSFRALILPEPYQPVLSDDRIAPGLQPLQLDWRSKHLAFTTTQLRDLLCDRLATYQLSPTHLNTFTDTEYGGPEKFLFNTILRFPSAPTVAGQFGNAMHETLEWVQHVVDQSESMPTIRDIRAHFAERLRSKKLMPLQYELELDRGRIALGAFMAQHKDMFKPGDRAEVNFKYENVHLGDVWMAGKIDRMEINKTDQTITVVDYKTGKPYSRWERNAKLHKYRQQLYCYKLLIENSRTFRGYKVTAGRLEFIEPDSAGRTHSLTLDFDDTQLDRIRQLLEIVWHKVHALEFPAIDDYDPTLAGIIAFEDFLLSDRN